VTAHRPVWAEVDLAAIAANVRALRAAVQPAEVLAVVKADGYGHGAVPVGRAALAAGASSLGVALVEEGVELRDAGVDAMILVLSEPVPEAAETVVQRRLTPVVYTAGGIVALAKAVATTGDSRLDVHLKIDTGMHRVGCRPEDALELARLVLAHPELRLAGTLTHFAVADEPENAYTAAQKQRFDAALRNLRAAGIDPGSVHACNTAGALAFPVARYDMARVGIGLYGIAPSHELEGCVALRPALSVKARVSYVKDLGAHERVSYGLRYETASDARIATVPIGYADGVPRTLGHAQIGPDGVVRGPAHALVRGARCAIAGTITMDQLMLDVGDVPVEVGDEVVLLGTQRDEAVTAFEWADLVGTIPYEIVCGIGPRVPRRYIG
jgi:alanine racemase